MQNYRIFGERPIEVVIELGLGACISEWAGLAGQLSGNCGVLVYERMGINKSPAPTCERTPKNIANELYELLCNVKHAEKLIIVAHSQGGLYAQQFCRTYPELVKGLVLLDPLSAKDNVFKECLTAAEYKKSGVDKSFNFKAMRTLAKLKLGGISKMLLKNAPPFYYYNGFTKEEANDILGCTKSATHAETALAEYNMAHEADSLKGLDSKNDYPDIPLILITHSSELAIEESMKFGSNTREFAARVEDIWQEIMKEYLSFSSRSRWIQAANSTHYIHLQEPKLVIEAVRELLK